MSNLVTVFKKEKENFLLCLGLKYNEFKCKCNNKRCRYTVISNKFLEKYSHFREDLDLPVLVTSGFRCQVHNEKVGGVENSFHTMGFAIDVKPMEKMKGKYLQKYFNQKHDKEPTEVNSDFEAIKYFAEKNGLHVIQYESFLHLDNRQDFL